MRTPPELGPPSSHRQLALALVLACAWPGCLNPRPEEYPGDTSSPGEEAAGAPAQGPSLQEGDDESNPNIAADPNTAPDVDQPNVPAEPPESPAPEALPDAGADAGDVRGSDAGVPAISE